MTRQDSQVNCLEGSEPKVLPQRLTLYGYSKGNISAVSKQQFSLDQKRKRWPSKLFALAQHATMPPPARIRHGQIKSRSRRTMRSQSDNSCLMGLTICFGNPSKLDAALAVVIRRLQPRSVKILGRNIGCMGAMLTCQADSSRNRMRCSRMFSNSMRSAIDPDEAAMPRGKSRWQDCRDVIM